MGVGPSATLLARPRFGAHGVEADINLPTTPVESVENDPKRTSCRPVMLMHNHPGGDPTPSRADIEMTRVIVEIAKQFGIAIQGHFIVGKQGHAMAPQTARPRICH